MAQTVQRYPNRFSRVAIRRNAFNRGAHFSLNRAMALARGRYLALMNSDDAFAPTRIERMVGALQESDAEWAFSSVTTIDANDRPYYDEAVCHHIYWRPRICRSTMPTMSWGFLAYQLTASTGNLLISRRLAQTLGGFANLRYCHDWDYMLRAIFYSEPVFVEEPLYLYRMHGTNSFRALSDAAQSETEYCLRNYFVRVMSRRPLNTLAPAPYNWPTLFRPLIASLGVETHLEALYEPYESHHRTIERTAMV